MKLFCYALYIVMLFFSACKKETTKKSEITAIAHIPAPRLLSPTKCYILNFDKDITAIEMTTLGDDVYGFYAWEPNQKDGGRGSFKGKKTDGIVTAIFEYMVEGSIQSEEIMLKIAGDSLMKANEPLKNQKGVMVIRDKSKIDWQNEVFISIDCAKIQEQIGRAKAVNEMIANAKK
jgi:hypothetical protein